MTESKEERIEELFDMKTKLAKMWVAGVGLSALLGVLWLITKDTYYIGMSLTTFIIISVAVLTGFSSLDNEQDELKEELKLDKLEERIEKLERELE